MRGSAVCVQCSVRVCFLRGMSFTGTGSCLCVLCGLPAAGKSSLAEVLRGRARYRGWDTLLVTYDELIPARDWREAEWKQQRKTVLMCLERFLHQTHKHTDQTHTLTDQTHTPCDDQTHKHTDDDDIWMRFQQIHNQSSSQTHTQPLLVLLDDNFYYQSMRYQIYQLARKNSMGFCQIFLRCPLDVCLQRNQRRSLRVPDEVLVQMFDRMEPPDVSRNSWERQSLTVDSTDGVTDEDVQKLMNLLESTMENPLSPFQDDSQQKRRKIPAASPNDSQFLGFKLKQNGKLDIRAAGFGVRSDWLDLNDLCYRTGIQLSWKRHDGEVVTLKDNLISDPLVSTVAILNKDSTPHQLQIKHARASILQHRLTQNGQHWTGLKLQGKLALLQFVDHSVSHSVLTNLSISDDILIFTIKARLQCLPTKYNLATWYPSKHEPYCILHQTRQEKETVAHILNGCCNYKGLYVARHDRLVDLIAEDLQKVFCGRDNKIYKHSTVQLNWFHQNTSDNEYFKNISNTPDIVIVNDIMKSVSIFEVGCCFDLYMDTCYYSKLLKYQLLVDLIHQLGYKCKLIILVFGSLGHVHKNVIRGMQLGGLRKKEAKRLAKFCSVSATIGSMKIWRRRCFVYP